MSEPMARATLEVLYELEASGGEIDIDQVLTWMVSLSEAIGELDPGERMILAEVAARMAAEASARGDDERANAYHRIADVEATE